MLLNLDLTFAMQRKLHIKHDKEYKLYRFGALVSGIVYVTVLTITF